jgi:hypothetical protein
MGEVMEWKRTQRTRREQRFAEGEWGSGRPEEWNAKAAKIAKKRRRKGWRKEYGEENAEDAEGAEIRRGGVGKWKTRRVECEGREDREEEEACGEENAEDAEGAEVRRGGVGKWKAGRVEKGKGGTRRARRSRRKRRRMGWREACGEENAEDAEGAEVRRGGVGKWKGRDTDRD